MVPERQSQKFDKRVQIVEPAIENGVTKKVIKTKTSSTKQTLQQEPAAAIPAKKPQNIRPIANVLIVDNEHQPARLLLEILAHKGIHANLVKDKKTALDYLNKFNYDLVFISDEIINCNLSDRTHHLSEPIAKIKVNSPEMPVVMMAKAQNPQQIIDIAVKAIRAGYYDFFTKPLNRQKIEELLDTILPNHSVSTQACAEEDNASLYRIIGRSPKLTQTINLAERIAPTSTPVLITGESGTGKELISYFVHHKSKRAQGPYIRVNCAALSDTLLESELFGHEKGAFTGAYIQRKGRFEMAHGGTLMLDEISETPLKFQAKLLRVLEQQDFERVGGNENVKVNVRIISTTNKDLLYEVSQSRFRQDLYYRLNAVRLVISPLRERPEDLPDLIWHFVNLYARQTQRRITKIDPVMMDVFANYSWPGNIRQLRNVVLTSLMLGIGSTLSLADVSWLFDELQPLPEIADSGSSENMTDGKIIPAHSRNGLGRNSPLAGIPLREIEQQAILDTLRQTAGNQTKAAKVLGISDRTLREKIRRYRQQAALQPT